MDDWGDSRSAHRGPFFSVNGGDHQYHRADEESLLSSADGAADSPSSKWHDIFACRSKSQRKRWQRWGFFLCGFVFFSAFFTLLLLLFFGVIHVQTDHQHSGGDPTTAPRGRFFQLSDVHMDVLYEATSNRTTFCRGLSAMGTAAAGFASASRRGDPSGRFPYGQYGCDSPVALVQSALDAMRAVDSRPDFILLTGDIPAHGLPTWAVQNETIVTFTSMLRQAFPDTLVLPLLGNNDVYPDYQLPYGSNAWLAHLAALWSPWLGQEQQETFARGGYYSMKIPASNNLRVIALNTVLYSVFFVPSNSTTIPQPYDACNQPQPADPNGQFAWLKAELAQAQARGEKVIIAGHIPYGVNEYDGSINWCAPYVESYFDVIYPFAEAGLIINQVFAHYHLDEFRVLLSPRAKVTTDAVSDSEDDDDGDGSKSVPVSNVVIHPSISPLHDNNPSFRYYHYYRETGVIADYAHFYLDLALVHLLPAPRWVLEYTFQGAYAVSGVDTKSYALLWETISSGFSSQFARYFGYKTSLYINNALPNLCALASMGRDAYERCLLQFQVDVLAQPQQQPQLRPHHEL